MSREVLVLSCAKRKSSKILFVIVNVLANTNKILLNDETRPMISLYEKGVITLKWIDQFIEFIPIR